MATRKHILIVDDDPDVAATLQDCLAHEGYRCERVADAEQALAVVLRQPPDLLLLDRVMPGMSGDELVVQLKNDPRTQDIPVILLTAKTEESDELVGLSLGADDYVTKPFSPKVLLARIGVKLRRRTADTEASSSLQARSITLDRTQPRVFVDNTPVPLTTAEYKILAALIAARGHVLGRQQLETMVFGKNAAQAPVGIEGPLDELRRKMGPAAGCIQSVAPGRYAFCYPSEQRAPA